MSKIDYEKERKKQMQSTSGRRLLLHSCCAPCSSGVIERLVDDFDITIYFYNPNMDCEEEYLKRANEQARYIKEAFSNKVKLVIPPYSKQEFLNGVAGLEGEPEGGRRCEKCFSLRFKKCLQYAEEEGFDFLTTTNAANAKPKVVNNEPLKLELHASALGLSELLSLESTLETGIVRYSFSPQ